MEKRERPSWDEFFMLSALLAAARSSCIYLQTGAVIIKDKRVIASGYNGAPPGIENCLSVGCRKNREGIDFDKKGMGVCRGVHAEINAMNQIARQELKGSSMYSLYFPCSGCAKAIVGNGLSELIYCKIYEEPESLTQELFEEAKINLRKLTLNPEEYFKVMGEILNGRLSKRR
ncbi:dCMP deaminase family protein [Candidatus Pacearchaeota archaeon]|nr:dCMP deaminase family protein [Candidatus Pacearchaeota archaeon]